MISRIIKEEKQFFYAPFLSVSLGLIQKKNSIEQETC